MSDEALRPFLVTEEVPCPPQSHAPATAVKRRPHRRVRRHVVRAKVAAPRPKPKIAAAHPHPHPHRRPHRRRPVVAARLVKPVSTRCEIVHPDWLKAMTPVTHDRVLLLPAAYETPDVLALPIFYPTPDTRVLGASPFATPTLPFGGGPGINTPATSPPTGPTTPPTTPVPPVGPPVVPPVSAAPEPAVWLQMMSAVALVGEALRRRRRRMRAA